MSTAIITAKSACLQATVELVDLDSLVILLDFGFLHLLVTESFLGADGLECFAFI